MRTLYLPKMIPERYVIRECFDGLMSKAEENIMHLKKVKSCILKYRNSKTRRAYHEYGSK